MKYPLTSKPLSYWGTFIFVLAISYIAFPDQFGRAMAIGILIMEFSFRLTDPLARIADTLDRLEKLASREKY